ncbi:MAG: ABC transporter ATP-binding protein [Planctomycetaceae bacterium]|nr:ABC transporter ATP-binding protein [Planctomycetaceae bacterium]
MTKPILDVAGFSFAIGGRAILRDLTFSIARGDRAAILGPNGAGKTTLLKCLNRIVRGGRGRIAVDGLPLEDYSQLDLARRVAYVPQADGRSAPFTVREFVEMSRYPHLGPLAPIRPQDSAAVDRALEETGTSGFAERPLEALSGGERQKVSIAAALAQEAELLLLDEPTAFLDPPRRQEILRTLADLHRERGMTLLFVTHDVNEALGQASRVLALREGALVFDGPSGALVEAGTLEKVYGHSFVIGPHPRSGRAVVFPE